MLIGKNGGTVLGYSTSADDAVGLQRRHAHRAVPVAVGVVVGEVAERVDVAVGPGVELVVVLRVEIGAVIAQIGAGVAIAGDDDVSIHVGLSLLESARGS